ncbi:MAG: ATP-dependent helicase [Acetatifactor sp.]|nr:ATP-dependent helicase [Acetatifactor sp.]
MLDLSDMNSAQRKAVTKADGPLLVLAGPGSGKTFTITRRILYLLEQGTPPEQLLVITFTREAAMSMQRRFQEMSKAFLPVNFGTFHSVFYHILKKSNVIKNQKLLNNFEKKKILLPILTKYCENMEEKTGESLGEDALQLLSAISFYKNTLRLEEAAGKAPAQWQSVFRAILEHYEKAVRSRGGLDFDDMLCRCRDLLTSDTRLLSSWQERFRHILIDEFQDINPVQYEVVKLLAGEHCSIFAVGDDDQAIYGFRGSEPECLRRFEREYNAEKVLLDVNYRSHPQIVRVSLAVVGENRDRFEKQLRPSPEREQGEEEQENRVRLLAFTDREEQYGYLIDRLQTFLRDRDDTKKECAVLFRTNSYMQGLAVRLRTAGIPFAMGERMQSVYEHFIAKDIMAYLTLAEGHWDREALLRIINRPSRYISREAVGSYGSSIQDLISYYEAQKRYDRYIESTLEKLRSFDRQLKAIGKLSPGLAVSYVQKAAGYGKYLQETAGNAERLAQWQETLEWLKADAGRFSSVEEWRAAQEAHNRDLEQGGGGWSSKKSQGTADGSAGKNGSAEQNTDKTDPVIRLMTVHGAKGLEFDTVIVTDCNETVFPHGRLQTGPEIEEERRVFYVAMTRAKENLELLYLTGTGERPRLPSRFLNPLL